MNPQESYFKECCAVSSMMTRLYNTRLTTTSGGNISLRINDDLFCISPSGLDKSCLTPQTIAIVTMDGENLTPHLKLSIESEMHRKLLCSRKDVSAIIHAHPCWSSFFSAIEDLKINTSFIAESYFLLGQPVMIPYHRMGTDQLADEVASSLGHSNIGILENHGVITLGTTLIQAFDFIEVLENSAKMTIAAAILNGNVRLRPLDEARKRELDDMKNGK
ncbi:MAG: class II aldolase/adducin family protein [Sphaerochaetaceae bacterium]|nr:class II aldolase/adducin family protein [Sphaerochaetaceae bacterium]NLY06921.1 class II aldolase/adducin family protein [Spirochaetales bacterium]